MEAKRGCCQKESKGIKAKEDNKELPQTITTNEVAVTVTTSAGKEELIATNSGQESC